MRNNMFRDHVTLSLYSTLTPSNIFTWLLTRSLAVYLHSVYAPRNSSKVAQVEKVIPPILLYLLYFKSSDSLQIIYKHS